MHCATSWPLHCRGPPMRSLPFVNAIHGLERQERPVVGLGGSPNSELSRSASCSLSCSLVASGPDLDRETPWATAQREVEAPGSPVTTGLALRECSNPCAASGDVLTECKSETTKLAKRASNLEPKWLEPKWLKSVSWKHVSMWVFFLL